MVWDQRRWQHLRQRYMHQLDDYRGQFGKYLTHNHRLHLDYLSACWLYKHL